MNKPIIFINSHTIQYFAPMYSRLNEMGIETACWYCSDEARKGGQDKEFGTTIKWDIPLDEGYESRYFKNYSWKPSHYNGFFGLFNPGMIQALIRQRSSVFVIHGWHYLTHLLMILSARVFGHTVCLRSEIPLHQEQMKSGFKQRLKKWLLKNILFPSIDYFLYIGSQNKKFYKSYGISDDRLISVPYSVDNDRFRLAHRGIMRRVPDLKKRLGIPEGDKVIIYSAKYIPKKRPLDILEAFYRLQNNNIWLIMIGEGELRQEMTAFINTHRMKNVALTGFINQGAIAEYYALGDLFVMCSGSGETWGLSVNEAMNFNMPVIVSDITGCAEDLVIPGVNGYVFRTGDVHDLAEKMQSLLVENALTNEVSSIDIINNFSYDRVGKNLRELVLD